MLSKIISVFEYLIGIFLITSKLNMVFSVLQFIVPYLRVINKYRYNCDKIRSKLNQQFTYKYFNEFQKLKKKQYSGQMQFKEQMHKI